MKTASKNVLTCAVMATLLGVSQQCYGAAQSTTSTVTTANDVTTPYKSINITAAGDDGINLGTDGTVYLTNGSTISVKGDAATAIIGPVHIKFSDGTKEVIGAAVNIETKSGGTGIHTDTIGDIVLDGGIQALNVTDDKSRTAHDSEVTGIEANDGKITLNGGIQTVELVAIGGTINVAQGGTDDISDRATAFDAAGSDGCQTINGNIGGISVEVTGGKITGGDPTYETVAMGFFATDHGQQKVNGDIGTMKIVANGGTAYSEGGERWTDAGAVGFDAYEGGTNTVTGDIEKLEVIANGGKIDSPSGVNNIVGAIGMMARDGKNILQGNVYITTKVNVNALGIWFESKSMSARHGGTNDLSASGKSHKLEGDVYSTKSGKNLLTLDTADSYLLGNIVSETKEGYPYGFNTVTIANGGTWKPVYDNRYGTSCVEGIDTQKNISTNTVSDRTLNAYNTINLNANGIIDLTWDNGENGAAIRTNSRTMTIENLNGADGLLRINSDLANNTADKLTIGSTGDISSLKIQVAYDPFYTKSTTEGDTQTGKAAVVDATAAANTVSVSAIATEYGEYKFTPTVETEGKITYLTMLTNNGGTTPAVKTEPSTNALAAGSMGRHVYDAWLADTNNISKRMGELRDTPEAKGGIWARMNRGKFSKGADAYDYNGIQVGYDVDHATKKGKTFTGFALDYLDGDTDAYRSTGTEKNATFTLYHSYLGDNGSYYDFTAKYGHIYGDYHVTDLNDKYSEAGYGTNTWTFSGEYGHRKTMSNGMYVEPQLELIYGHIKGHSYTTSYPLEVNVEATKRFITRLGVSVGKEFENKSTLYFTASWNHDFGSDLDYKVGDLSMTKELPGNWGSFVLGGTAKLGKKTNAFLQLEKLTGGMGSDLMCNVGLRYNF